MRDDPERTASTLPLTLIGSRREFALPANLERASTEFGKKTRCFLDPVSHLCFRNGVFVMSEMLDITEISASIEIENQSHGHHLP
jgi:hypothetical protein